MTVGSLFSGIGGMDIGFERAGFTIKWMCEIDPFCRKVLNKHWPGVPVYEDVRFIRGSADKGLEVLPKPDAQRRNGRANDEGKQAPKGDGHTQTVEYVDCLIGGFPCQDISLAGKGAGLDGARSGLWWEFYRLIGELRPRYVVLENVAALVIRGLPAILGALSEVGYDAEWQIVSAASVGAPHIRERLFVVADTASQGCHATGSAGETFHQPGAVQRPARCGSASGVVSNAHGQRQSQQGRSISDFGRWSSDGGQEEAGRGGSLKRRLGRDFDGLSPWLEPDWERGIPRTIRGQSDRVARLRALGNSVVPQVAQYIARCIMRHATESPGAVPPRAPGPVAA